MKKCAQCHRGEPQGAKFATLVRSGEPDSLCVECRFEEIDGHYSDPAGIREDMRAAGIPVSDAGTSARKLR